jgi:hypothetical protein
MANYRYLAHDLRTGALLGELPLTGVRYGHKLNGAGTLSASITLGQRTTLGASLDQILLDAVTPNRTALYVARDDVLVWGGILWEHPDYDSDTRTLQIGGAEHWSYFRRRRLRADKDYFPAWDQFDLVRDLVAWAQAQPGGNIGVDTSSINLSGVTRDPEYRAFERRVIGQIVEEFAATEDGFDFAIDVAGTPGEPVLTLSLAAERGRRPEATGLVFEPGKNLGSYRWPISGTSSANSIDAIGNGEGDDMLIATSTRTELIDAGFPLLDDVVAYKTIDDEVQLAARAASASTARAWPVTTATLVNVMPSGDPPLGSWIMGDWARFRVDDDERFPARADGSPGIDRYVRIIADEVNVSDAGVETVNITVEVRDA